MSTSPVINRHPRRVFIIDTNNKASQKNYRLFFSISLRKSTQCCTRSIDRSIPPTVSIHFHHDIHNTRHSQSFRCGCRCYLWMTTGWLLHTFVKSTTLDNRKRTPTIISHSCFFLPFVLFGRDATSVIIIILTIMAIIVAIYLYFWLPPVACQQNFILWRIHRFWLLWFRPITSHWRRPVVRRSLAVSTILVALLSFIYVVRSHPHTWSSCFFL